VRQVAVPKAVCAYAAQLVSATHVNGQATPEAVRKYVRLGCSPRGIQALVLGAKVRALCDGRSEIRTDDIRSVAVPALGHRMLLNFEGHADRIETDQIVRGILEQAAA
jgi:MoxR-like ATPase